MLATRLWIMGGIWHPLQDTCKGAVFVSHKVTVNLPSVFAVFPFKPKPWFVLHFVYPIILPVKCPQ